MGWGSSKPRYSVNGFWKRPLWDTTRHMQVEPLKVKGTRGNYKYKVKKPGDWFFPNTWWTSENKLERYSGQDRGRGDDEGWLGSFWSGNDHLKDMRRYRPD